MMRASAAVLAYVRNRSSNGGARRIVTTATPLRSLYVQVLLAMALGVSVGHFGRTRARCSSRSAMPSSGSCG
jgi:hypothetical protein